MVEEKSRAAPGQSASLTILSSLSGGQFLNSASYPTPLVSLVVWETNVAHIELGAKTTLPMKPNTIEAYKKWMSDNVDINIDLRMSTHYESVVSKCHTDICESVFWTAFCDSLDAHNQRYTIDTAYPLLLSTAAPNVLKKPYSSFIDKTFRKNIVNNRSWPKPPNGGWIGPSNWFSRVGDLVRTTIVVKYLDGVEFLVAALEALATDHGLSVKTYFESREEGYYAAHCYVYYEIAVPTLDWQSEVVRVGLEIQITTQLQEVIRRLLHSHYQERRTKLRNDERSWQWRYRDEEFSANYLGHILHYLEGQIVEIREKKNHD